jgi:hypothetical protein
MKIDLALSLVLLVIEDWKEAKSRIEGATI